MLSARAVGIDANGLGFPAKTPGREKGRLENSIATTVRRRGKNILVPKTPSSARAYVQYLMMHY